MRPISDKSDTSEKNDSPPLPATSCESTPACTGSEAANLSESRLEKLARIRAAIDAGHYDSDELLEKSLARMLQRFENDEDSRNHKQ